ncbi:MAG TPA: nuclear transport factor 2 family protein [bacterium]|nr:nuclear transport factor 2 family protein [bacterium]
MEVRDEFPYFDVLKRIYDALGRGDVPSLMALLASDIAWTEAERVPYYTGTWRTPQQVVDHLLVPLARDWDGYSAKPESYVAEGERVVAFGAYAGTYKATGKATRCACVPIGNARNGNPVR